MAVNISDRDGAGAKVEDTQVQLFSGGLDNTAYVLNGGVTWADIKADYLYADCTIFNPAGNLHYEFRIHPETLTLSGTQNLVIKEGSLGINGASGSIFTLQNLGATDGAFTRDFNGGDTYNLEIRGYKKQKTVINTIDAPVSLTVIPKAITDTYISGATTIGTTQGQVNPTDWLIEEITSNGVTKVTINGRFDYWHDDDEVIITFPAGTITTPMSAMAAREANSHTAAFDMEIVDGDTYTINRDNTIDLSHGASFQIVGIK